MVGPVLRSEQGGLGVFQARHGYRGRGFELRLELPVSGLQRLDLGDQPAARQCALSLMRLQRGLGRRAVDQQLYDVVSIVRQSRGQCHQFSPVADLPWQSRRRG